MTEMTTRTRTTKKMNVRLESLESREAPTVGLAGAWQAALAQAQGHSLRGTGFQSVQRALPVARPGSTFQGATAHLGVISNSGGGVSRAPTNSMFTLGQTRRAALNTAVPTLRTAMANRVQSQPASAARSSMRTPAIPSTPATRMPQSNPPNVNPTADAGTPAQSLPANVSGDLKAIYEASQGSSTVPVSEGPGAIVIDGTNVGVSVHGNGQGSFSDFVGTLQNLGMEINATNDVTWTVTGMLPIKQLPAAAQTPQTRSISPMYRPVTM